MGAWEDGGDGFYLEMRPAIIGGVHVPEADLATNGLSYFMQALICGCNANHMVSLLQHCPVWQTG